ncbi:MAG TPA: peptidoglycan-binding domain-containing protein [Candidatus Paceibacterota bacterium]|nr:peptidoglycan-binding domain-containing protein [Candidatus Paceibacterota bacterium]
MTPQIVAGRRSSFLVGIFFAFLIALVPSMAAAATAIYRSVGVNATAALDSGNGTKSLTISGSTATFSGAIANNVGVGDVIQYDSAGGGTINSVAFIYGRTDSTHYTVKNATGGTPTAVTGSTAWGVYRAYTTLRNGFYGSENTGINAAVRDFDPTFSGIIDLNAGFKNAITLDQQWNFAVYNSDGTADGGAYLFGWTTGPTTYVRMYTPTSTAEVGTSQRSSGNFDASKYYNSDGQGLWLVVNYARVDGLQMAQLHTAASTSAAGEFQVSNNIIGGTGGFFNYLDESVSTGGSINLKFWNNVVSDVSSGGGAIDIRYLGGQVEFYNNTFYNNPYPFFVGASNMILKNNIFASTTDLFRFGGSAAASSDYNSATAGSFSGYTPNTHDRFTQTFSFNDIANRDYNLSASDAGARDHGVDLSADSFIPFSYDLAAHTRPGNSVWDIGALEYMPAPDTTPPGRSAGAPSGRIATSTTSTNLTLNTNESATCKYSTTAGTAYGSMSNTFTTTGGTSHSQTLSGLSSGHLYTYYVRCQDAATNANTDDYQIQFFVNQNGRVYADSCSVPDVNTAYGYTYVGDTLSIPAGTCSNWSSSAGLFVGKAITVEGAGQGQTILNMDPATGSYANAAIVLGAGATIKSLTIQTDTGNSGTAFSADGPGFRITDVKYVDRSGTNSGYFLFFTANAYSGLVDKNDITGNNGQMELIFGRGPTNAWQTNNTLGSSTNIFIENNVFKGVGYVSDCNANARCVVRNNTITAQNKIDAHGLCTNSSPARGVREMEVYNNYWTSSANAWTAIELRGGTGIVFGNKAPNLSQGANAAWLYLTDYGYQGSCGNFVQRQTPNDYPIADQIGVGKDPKSAASEPYYVWGNLLGGAAWPRNLATVDSAAISLYGSTFTERDMIQSNRDFFADAGFDTNTGVTSGVLASRPGTCSTGSGYWATDQGGNWDTSNGTSADGALYKCVSTNTWGLNYIPYAYPHYLSAASTTGTDLVDVGAGARMFETGKFYGLSTSTASGVYATFAATTTSQSADAWLDVSISLWSNSGIHHKTWTESSTNMGATTTYHMIGDLDPSTSYDVKIDGVAATGNISGAACSAGSCTSNSSGKIYFSYTGGYSTHTFDVQQSGSAIAPTITTSAASSIAATTATLNGSITSTGGADATQSGFAYGTASNLSTVIATSTLGSQTGNASFNSNISSLTCNTLYYFRAYATNTAGTGYGSILSFTTSACAPTVTTQAASSIANSSATLNGNITATGGANASIRGAIYGLTTAYGATTTESGSFSTGAFTASATGLACNTLYHTKAYATNSGGTSYGSDTTFTTSACVAPSVTTSAASSIGQTAATLNGLISATGGQNATQSGFAYGTSSSLTDVIATSTLGSQTGTASFSSSISSLTCETTYYFRAYATNPTATGYGSVTSLVTSSCVTPVVETPSSGGSSRPSSSTRRAIANVVTSLVSVFTGNTVTVVNPAASISLPSLSAFIETLIKVGVIPPDKAETARNAIQVPASSAPAQDMQYHDMGSQVTALQSALVAKGYLKAAPNGVFGPATLAAVKAFQKDMGVPVTGFYGPLTRAALSR